MEATRCDSVWHTAPLFTPWCAASEYAWPMVKALCAYGSPSVPHTALWQSSHPASTQWPNSTAVQLLNKLQVTSVSVSVHFPTSQMQEERNSPSTQVTSSRYLPPVPPCETSWKTAAHYRQHFCTHLQELQLHLEIQSFQSFRTVNDRHGKPFFRRVLHNSHFPLYIGYTLQEVSKAIFPLKIVVFFRTLPAKHLTKLHQPLLFVQGKRFSVNTHKHLTVPKVLLRKGIMSTRGNHAHSAKQENTTARSLRGRQPWSQQGWAKCHSWKGNALTVPEAIAPLTFCMFCLYISSPTSSHHHTLLEVFIWGL